MIMPQMVNGLSPVQCRSVRRETKGRARLLWPLFVCFARAKSFRSFLTFLSKMGLFFAELRAIQSICQSLSISRENQSVEIYRRFAVFEHEKRNQT